MKAELGYSDGEAEPLEGEGDVNRGLEGSIWVPL